MRGDHAYQHWRLKVDTDAIAWLYLDKQGAGVNVLSGAVLEEFDKALEWLAKDRPGGLVIVSGKANGFIAGADITEFTELKDAAQALCLIRQGQAVFDRLEALPFPIVAQIHGFCLGGGLELALACRYRVARDDGDTRLGLPEVRVGIHPGFGGTARLSRLIGATAALDLMVSGRTVSARRARALGFVNAVVPERYLSDASRRLIHEAPRSGRAPLAKRLASTACVRPLLAKYLAAKLARRVSPSHYPAPFALIELFRRYGGEYRRMLSEEGPSVARLITGSTARNLVRVFLLKERLKSLGRAASAPIQYVHVIGAGVMGGDIATWCVQRGLTVTLQDRGPEWIAPAVARAHRYFQRELKDRRLVQAAMDRLVPDHVGAGVAQADVVIEAISEDLKAKQALYQVVEPRLKRHAVLATNTSSIPLERLSRRLKKPSRLVGLHFFNPVAKMQLVEVVAGHSTGVAVLEYATAFCRRIDRLPLPVASAPGFLVNRILMPYLLEAVVLVSEGVPVATIDQAAKDFGMPMGPLELADSVGLDICLSVAQVLGSRLAVEVPALLREKVKAGHLGRKADRGFYTYRKGKPIGAGSRPEKPLPDDIQERLILPMLNESVACLREGVVEDRDLLDAGMIFGTGFAPFRGGPMHYIGETGGERVRSQLQRLAQIHGARFSPDKGWAGFAASN
ncbi:MAG: 3-hydroxyacyl-CoA dehydrogenase NAD-binding domain-containing protein [Gammaproteobacteria bacterium]|nr:3-hydroxyacyl-CoA dehydrogenase NAD-binding domain-containing protein [Gammaproteobacteria bacterium]